MAERKIRRAFKMPPEMKTELESAGDDIEKAEHALKVMKELGMDTTEIEGKLTWAKSARETMLREFS